MKAILFALVVLSSSFSIAADTDSVVFPRVDVLKLAEATIAAVKSSVDATMPRMVWSKEMGSPTLLAVSQDEKGNNTRFELEIEIEMKYRNSPQLFESFCMVELDGSLNVLYASCEGYEPEPWD